MPYLLGKLKIKAHVCHFGCSFFFLIKKRTALMFFLNKAISTNYQLNQLCRISGPQGAFTLQKKLSFAVSGWVQFFVSLKWELLASFCSSDIPNYINTVNLLRTKLTDSIRFGSTSSSVFPTALTLYDWKKNARITRWARCSQITEQKCRSQCLQRLWYHLVE